MSNNLSNNNAVALWEPAAFNNMQKLSRFVEYFQVRTARTPVGIPVFLVNPMGLADGIHEWENYDDVPDEHAENAKHPIECLDGVPMIDGVPVWERIDGEPVEYYTAFREYLGLKKAQGGRSILKTAQSCNLKPKELNVMAKLYHWPFRAKVYDECSALVEQEIRRQEAQKMEGLHLKSSNKMLTMAMEYLEKHPQQLNPKVAIQMIDLAVKMGRQSVGLQVGSSRAGGSETNININQTANTSGAGEIVAQATATQKDSTDFGYMQSILHVLDQSGALATTKGNEVIDVEVADDDA